MANPVVTMTGRIGTDVDFKTFGEGSVARFRLITQDHFKDSNGQWQDKDTSGWNIKAWYKLADMARDTLKKGQEITITGVAKEEQWTDKEGNKRTSVEIKANTIAVSLSTLSKNLVGAGAPTPWPSATGGDNTWNAEGDTPF